MSHSQLRVQLVVVAGVLGASLLSATFTGCQSSPGNQMQANGPYGQMNPGQHNPYAAYGQGQPGQFAGQPGQYAGQPGQFASYPAPDPQQQAFLAETQRLGAQQNLSPQDVVAMSRGGVPDPRIARAVQQRGAAVRGTPGVGEYLAQNGVNPGVVDASRQPAAGYPQSYGAVPGADASGGGMQAAGGMNMAGQMPAGQFAPAQQFDPGQVQPAGYETASGQPSGMEASAAATPGQTWRSKAR